METPRKLRTAADGRELHVREQEGVLTVDFDPAASDLSVDTVGDTAIVVTGDEQFEFEVPDGVEDVTANDGMLVLKRRE